MHSFHHQATYSLLVQSGTELHGPLPSHHVFPNIYIYILKKYSYNPFKIKILPPNFYFYGRTSQKGIEL
jgi:hypothetical protein